MMEDYFKIPDAKLRHTSRHLREELQKRGWKDAKIARGAKSSLIYATRPDGKKMRFCSCYPYETSFFARTISSDKLQTYLLFTEHGILQPETIRVSKNEEEMRYELKSLLERHDRIVVKPVDGAHGHGVMPNITDTESAVKAAKALIDSGVVGVIAQEQISFEGYEQRVICIDYKFVAAYDRIPAAVTGDGVHTILQLIDKENADFRAEAYRGDITKIDTKAAYEYLEKNNIDSSRIPEVGESVRVMSLCNLGMGGTVKSVEISDERRELAEKVAKISDLPVIGIDFFGDKIIEINAGPSLYYPTGDENADKCVKKYVDYLESR